MVLEICLEGRERAVARTRGCCGVKRIGLRIELAWGMRGCCEGERIESELRKESRGMAAVFEEKRWKCSDQPDLAEGPMQVFPLSEY